MKINKIFIPIITISSLSLPMALMSAGCSGGKVDPPHEYELKGKWIENGGIISKREMDVYSSSSIEIWYQDKQQPDVKTNVTAQSQFFIHGEDAQCFKVIPSTGKIHYDGTILNKKTTTITITALYNNLQVQSNEIVINIIAYLPTHISLSSNVKNLSGAVDGTAGFSISSPIQVLLLYDEESHLEPIDITNKCTFEFFSKNTGDKHDFLDVKHTDTGSYLGWTEKAEPGNNIMDSDEEIHISYTDVIGQKFEIVSNQFYYNLSAKQYQTDARLTDKTIQSGIEFSKYSSLKPKYHTTFTCTLKITDTTKNIKINWITIDDVKINEDGDYRIEPETSTQFKLIIKSSVIQGNGVIIIDAELVNK